MAHSRGQRTSIIAMWAALVTVAWPWPMRVHAQTTGAGTRDLLRLASTAVADSLAPGWERRVVRGARAPSSMVRGVRAERLWAVESAGAAAWYSLDLRSAPMASNATIELISRIAQAPTGADLARADRNDSALRFFVVMQDNGRLLTRQRMIMYSFGAADTPLTVDRQRRTLCDIQRARPASRDWLTDTLIPWRDATRYCGWKQAPIVAVGFMHDTDQTSTPARVEIRRIGAITDPSRRDSTSLPPSAR